MCVYRRVNKEDLETQVSDLTSLLEQQASEIEGYDDRVLELKKAAKKVQSRLAKVQAERDGLRQQLATLPRSTMEASAAPVSQVRSPLKNASPGKVRVLAGAKRPCPTEQPPLRPSLGPSGLGAQGGLGVKSSNQQCPPPSCETGEKSGKGDDSPDGAEKRTNVSLLRQQLLRAKRPA